MIELRRSFGIAFVVVISVVAVAAEPASASASAIIERSSAPFYLSSPAVFRFRMLPQPQSLRPQQANYGYLGSYRWFATQGPVPFGRPGGEPLPFGDMGMGADGADAPGVSLLSASVVRAMDERLGLGLSLVRTPTIEGYEGLFLQTDLDRFREMRPGVPLPPGRPWLFLRGAIHGREARLLFQEKAVLVLNLEATAEEVASAARVRSVLASVAPKFAVEELLVVPDDPSLLEEAGRRFVTWGVPEVELLRSDGSVSRTVKLPTIVLGVSLE